MSAKILNRGWDKTMLFKSLTAAAALAALASPAFAQTPEAQLTTPPPADEAQAAPAPQGQPAAPQGQPTEEQQQAAIQRALQQYLVMYGIGSYAERCEPLPAGEAYLLDAQVQIMEDQFSQAGADLTEQRDAVMTQVNNAECGSEQFQTAYEAMSQQLAAPIDQLVLSFDAVEPSCRNMLLTTDDGRFSALVERRKARHGGEVPADLQTGVEQTAGAISGACSEGNQQEMAAMKQGVEVQAIQDALSE